MLEFSVISSGSSANCIYVTDGEARILIDCGLSAREAARRLSLIGIEADSIDAIVITHEHSDHIRGVRVFAKRHGAAVFVTPATSKGIEKFHEISQDRINYIESGRDFGIGKLKFQPFSILHDARDPVAFRIENEKASLGILTDLGQVTNLVRQRAQNLNAIVLESNHDPQLLQQAPYPWSTKQRISSRQGHLSNQSAGTLLSELNNCDLRRPELVVAAHISENSNTADHALNALEEGWCAGFSKELPAFVAASRYEASEIYRLT